MNKIMNILNMKKKRMKKLITINKEEARLVREKFPNAHIMRTMKQKSKRGRYYCEENRKVINFINNIRKKNVVESYGNTGCNN